jgi:Fur family transcriptional regulator, zinc uptake regulator
MQYVGNIHTSQHNGVHPEVVLREHGFRATSTRVALLRLLESAGTPLSIQGILEHWVGQVPDTATLYRSLTDLHAAGVVKRIELGTGSAHFEYTPARPHHHHIVCNSCGLVEELNHCMLHDIDVAHAYHTKKFKSIYSHNLEFFGLCKECAAQKI